VKTAFSLPDPKETGKPSLTTLENDQSLKIYPLQVLRILPASGPDFFAEMGSGFFNQQPDPAVQTFSQKYLDVRAVAQRIKFTLPEGSSWPKKPSEAEP
jgi:hypothetical protein